MRKTKIICTLGPACDNEEILKRLVLSGMDVARTNFSHGSHEEHKKRIDLLKKVAADVGRPVALLLDTKGPEIRIGRFEGEQAVLTAGQFFILTPEEIIGDEHKVSITYKELYRDVKVGSHILIDDGLIELEVHEILGQDIHCRVLNGGKLGNKKGINVPGAEIRLPSITQQDIEDIRFGIENDYDFIAASFVRKADDVAEIKRVLEKHGGHDLKVISKIENRQGVQNIDEIIMISDGIMVARGDLGVEIPVEEVPIVQKMLIEKFIERGLLHRQQRFHDPHPCLPVQKPDANAFTMAQVSSCSPVKPHRGSIPQKRWRPCPELQKKPRIPWITGSGLSVLSLR